MNFHAVENIHSAAAGSAARAGSTRANAHASKGLGFARIVKCLGMAKGSRLEAAQIAEALYAQDRSVVSVLKAAVSAGSISANTWGSELVGAETSAFADFDDFVEFLRPMTIIGKFGAGGIPGLLKVPFRVPLLGQTSGGAGYWVGEGKPKPLTAFSFSRTTIEPRKVANIAVAMMELLRDSSPSAEALIRSALADALRERLDIDFIDPANAGTVDVKPASILNGVTAITSSGNDADAVRADIKAILSVFIAANNAPTSGVWIMASTIALALSQLRNPLGQREFPGIGINGGTFEEMPVIVSEYVPTTSAGSLVALINAQDIYFADEGGIAVDMSQEASLQMLDNPTNDSVTPTATTMVSMFQTNSVAFRAERTLNWARRRASAVAYLSGVNWGA